MNTLLPNSTIKNLKMIVTAICLTVVFVLANDAASAQQVIDARYATPEAAQRSAYNESIIKTAPVVVPAPVVEKNVSVLTETKSVEKVDVKQAVTQVTPENQPYLNYKGISNPKEARKIWMAENPEAAQKLSEKLQQESSNKKVEPVRK
jgi:hypothetical protein